MDGGEATDLETALADAGALLLRLEKYHGSRRPEVDALRHDVFAAGDGARRLHRTRTLDAGGVAALQAAVTDATTALARIVDDILGSEDYRTAIDAHRVGDGARLMSVLPRIFADLAPAPRDGDLFWSLAWARRGRPLAPAAIVDTLERLRRHGLPAAGDVLDRGTDPDLPAVAFSPTWPPGAPLALRIAAAELDGPVMRCVTDGNVLVYRRAVTTPFVVALMLDRDEVDEWVDDPGRYHEALRPLLHQHGFRVVEVTTSAAP